MSWKFLLQTKILSYVSKDDELSHGFCFLLVRSLTRNWRLAYQTCCLGWSRVSAKQMNRTTQFTLGRLVGCPDCVSCWSTWWLQWNWPLRIGDIVTFLCSGMFASKLTWQNHGWEKEGSMFFPPPVIGPALFRFVGKNAWNQWYCPP